MSNLSITTLAVSAIIVDTVIGYYLLITKRGGKYIKEWYKNFTIGAYVMDILSIVIGTYIATRLTSNFYHQIILVVIVGLIHDLSFGFFLNRSGIRTPVLNLFTISVQGSTSSIGIGSNSENFIRPLSVINCSFCLFI